MRNFLSLRSDCAGWLAPHWKCGVCAAPCAPFLSIVAVSHSVSGLRTMFGFAHSFVGLQISLGYSHAFDGVQAPNGYGRSTILGCKSAMALRTRCVGCSSGMADRTVPLDYSNIMATANLFWVAFCTWLVVTRFLWVAGNLWLIAQFSWVAGEFWLCGTQFFFGVQEGNGCQFAR